MSGDETIVELEAELVALRAQRRMFDRLFVARKVSLWGGRLLIVAAVALGSWGGLEFAVHGAQAFPLALSVLAILAGAWGLLGLLDRYGDRLEDRLEVGA